MLGVAETPNILLTNTSHDTSHSGSGGSDWDNLVEGYIVVVGRLVAEGFHGESQADFVAVVDLDGGILLLDKGQQHLGIHGLRRLTLFRLTEADLNNLRNVLLLHKLQIQLLETDHLVVVEPIGGLQLLQFVHHLSIQLLIIDLARVVDHQPVRDLDADVATTASGILQRMTVVGRGHERGITGTILLGSSEDRTTVHLTNRQCLLQRSLLRRTDGLEVTRGQECCAVMPT